MRAKIFLIAFSGLVIIYIINKAFIHFMWWLSVYFDLSNYLLCLYDSGIGFIRSSSWGPPNHVFVQEQWLQFSFSSSMLFWALLNPFAWRIDLTQWESPVVSSNLPVYTLISCKCLCFKQYWQNPTGIVPHCASAIKTVTHFCMMEFADYMTVGWQKLVHIYNLVFWKKIF